MKCHTVFYVGCELEHTLVYKDVEVLPRIHPDVF